LKPLRTNFPSRDIGRTVDYEAMKRHGFRDQGILVVKVDDPKLNDWERQFLRNIGAKIHGQGRA
jgi:hypothetical protein